MISGLSSAAYYSDQSKYSLTLRSTVASCMAGMTPSNVVIVNVTDAPSSRRRSLLDRSPAASIGLSSARTAHLAAAGSSAGILSSYVVSVASQYSLSDLQSQLAASTTNGVFNKQLSSFAQKYNAAGFVNATSAALVILTTAPTRAPTAAPVRSPVSSPSSSSSKDSELGAGPIAGLVIMSVVVSAGLCVAVYYLFIARTAPEAVIFKSSSSRDVTETNLPNNNVPAVQLDEVDLEVDLPGGTDDIVYHQDVYESDIAE